MYVTQMSIICRMAADRADSWSLFLSIAFRVIVFSRHITMVQTYRKFVHTVKAYMGMEV